MVSGRFSKTKEGLPKSEEFRLLGRLTLHAFPWAAGSGLPHRQLCFFKTLGHTNRNFFCETSSAPLFSDKHCPVAVILENIPFQVFLIRNTCV